MSVYGRHPHLPSLLTRCHATVSALLSLTSLGWESILDTSPVLQVPSTRYAKGPDSSLAFALRAAPTGLTSFVIW